MENNNPGKNENDSDLYANPFSNSNEKDENVVQGNQQKENIINYNILYSKKNII